MSLARMAFLVGGLLIAASGSVAAQNVTAFKTGEETTGLTKQCYYAFGVTKYTKTINAAQLCPLSVSVRSSGSRTLPEADPLDRPSITAFKSGEETTGLTKQCFYTFGTTKYTRTIKAAQLCPLTIRVRTH